MRNRKRQGGSRGGNGRNGGSRTRLRKTPLAQLRAELEAAKDRELRCHAELDNYRKRAARELEERLRYANLRPVARPAAGAGQRRAGDPGGGEERRRRRAAWTASRWCSSSWKTC